MTLQKPVAMITGGRGGIGQATAARLSSSHRIVIADVSADAMIEISEGVVASVSDIRDRALWVTINREAVRNALNDEVLAA